MIPRDNRKRLMKPSRSCPTGTIPVWINTRVSRTASPAKTILDLLVQNFLSRANYYYYILYPPQFSKQYSDWWSDRAASKPLTPELTSLILLTCACSCQFLKSDLRDRVEPELGANASILNQRFAKAAKRLSATISPGRGGMTLVVQKLLTAFWCKSEALFIEAWHVLSAAIREAQELGKYMCRTPIPRLGRLMS